MTLGEFELIARLAPYLDPEGQAVVVGHGDDAAVLRVGGEDVCLTVDALVEERHFRRAYSSFADIGWKALTVNVSDVAAMGGRPLAAVVALCRPADLEPADVESLYAGLREAADRYDVRLLGGDTVAADRLMLSVTVLGRTRPGRAVRRSGAGAGERLVLVGSLGAGAAGLALLERGLDGEEQLLDSYRRPRALVDAGAALAEHGATAMIDLSDGLGVDLGHVCQASGVGARVDAAALPVEAGVAAAAQACGLDLWPLVCGGGEDFALLATLPADHAGAAASAAGRAEGVAAAVIGDVTAYRGDQPRTALTLPDGTVCGLEGLGYDHYRTERG